MAPTERMGPMVRTEPTGRMVPMALTGRMGPMARGLLPAAPSTAY
ncbi:MAG: hypothetical protein AAF371_07030 [Pseudomonadota bacterium]